MSQSDRNEAAIGELSSLYEMLESAERKKRFDKILIPKIQRDYAQGRENQKQNRDRFLKRLFSAIEREDAKEVVLDFVYGQNRNSEFLPLDGQQRLTTLFLLHLYIGKRCGEDVAWLKHFSYDTRESSKEFCFKLIGIEGDKYNGIKNYIENQWWFTSRWSADPTIHSMLVMLDAVDQHCTEWNEEKFQCAWTMLVERANIKFWRLKIDDLNTSDDLYIKMNSRGKPLTPFEHFKAELESYMKKDGDESSKKKASAFSLKIDTVWTNLLWNYRTQEADSQPEEYAQNGLDTKFANIFRHFIVIEGVKQGKELSALYGMPLLNLSETILKPQPKLIEKFGRIMDFFAELPDVKCFFNEILTDEGDELRINKQTDAVEDNYRVYIPSPLDGPLNIFERAVMWDKFENARLLLLEAFFYLAETTNSQELDFKTIRNRIRIIRNLILNSKDEIRADRMGALLCRVDCIMAGGELDENSEREFRQNQIKQENLKLAYMEKHPGDEWIIKFAENHNSLKGNLSLYINGDAIVIDLLTKHEAMCHAGVSYDLIERFLLTYGDYASEIGGKKAYGGRDINKWWSEIFTQGEGVAKTEITKALSANSNFDDASMESRIDKWLCDCETNKYFPWRYYLVKYSGARKGEGARYDRSTEFVSYNYMMMNKINYNGKHWNPYLYCLYEKMATLGATLGDYNAKLVFSNEEMMVEAQEAAFVVTFKDASQKTIDVPQTAINDVLTDNVDRIEWAYKELNTIISEQNGNNTEME